MKDFSSSKLDFCFHSGSQKSIVCITTTGESCIRIQAAARNFVVLQNVRTGSRGQPSAYLTGNDVRFEGSSDRAVK